eukprot:CAMPEP_0119553960 /NCGR_PEP_ID=MMETSP1352-20130426/6564_1 /TAXON_ID=265584 /ORGANISM="Stauroneis constricta, Strain CCMP1120" /LENGTH=150 /DNA_ID=CAMNT_0007600453 /DNA_START=211 /DNA_END=659 /DNA_ORIENTATION=+
MSSRDSSRRYQSQPRPRKVETPRPQNTFENWEINVQDGKHSRQHLQSNMRSKSSMRYQSAPRQHQHAPSSSQQPYHQPQHQAQSQQQRQPHPSPAYQDYVNSNGRNSFGGSSNRQPTSARSASTGRMRKPQTQQERGNAVDVANQIWQLR